MEHEMVEVWTCFGCGRAFLPDNTEHDCAKTYPIYILSWPDELTDIPLDTQEEPE